MKQIILDERIESYKESIKVMTDIAESEKHYNIEPTYRLIIKTMAFK